MARRLPDTADFAGIVQQQIEPVYEALNRIDTRFKELNGSVSRTIERVARVETTLARVPEDIATSAKMSAMSVKLWLLVALAGGIGQLIVTLIARGWQ